MKSVSYTVYVHLDQLNGEVGYAGCCCKAGQGGCCKHVTAFIYTVLDFFNLTLEMIPADLTCNQFPQKWSVSSGCSKTLNKAVKCENLFLKKLK